MLSKYFSFLVRQETLKRVNCQNRIWSLAALTNFEETYAKTFAPLERYRTHVQGSSPVELRDKSQRPSPPKLLGVNRESRMITLGMFTRMRYTCDYGHRVAGCAYFNTLYDTFYVGGGVWDDFKVIIDLVI